MDIEILTVLSEYEERYHREFDTIFPALSPEQVLAHRDDMLMSVGPETGTFLNALIKGIRSARIVELGTSYGHSTIYLAEAARAVDGTVITCDHSAKKQEFARHMLQKAGLDQYVDFRVGDAVNVVSGLTNEIDFCLIDLWTPAYLSSFRATWPKLATAGIIVTDNMIVPDTTEAREYRKAVRATPDVESILLPIGWGLEITRRV